MEDVGNLVTNPKIEISRKFPWAPSIPCVRNIFENVFVGAADIGRQLPAAAHRNGYPLTPTQASRISNQKIG